MGRLDNFGQFMEYGWDAPTVKIDNGTPLGRRQLFRNAKAPRWACHLP